MYKDKIMKEHTQVENKLLELKCKTIVSVLITLSGFGFGERWSLTNDPPQPH